MVDGTYGIGRARVGFRSTSAAFGEWLDAALARYRMKRWVSPDYSIVVDEGGAPGRRFHVLYQGLTPLVRTFHLPTLGRALLSELESLVIHGRDDAAYVRASVAAMGEATALVPAWSGPALSSMARRADRAGLRLPGTTWVAVDRSGRIVPREPLLDVPRDTLDRLAAMDGGRRWDRVFVEEPASPDVAFTWLDGPEADRGLTPGVALHRLLEATANLPRVAGWAPRALRSLAARTDHRAIVGLPRPRDLVDEIAGALADGRAA